MKKTYSSRGFFPLPSNLGLFPAIKVTVIISLVTLLSMSGANAMPEHPYMLFTAETLPALRERFNEPRYQSVKEDRIALAEKFLTYTGEGKFESDPETFAARSYKTWAQQASPARSAFLWGYILTGDTRYSDALLQMYRHEWKIRENLDQSQFRFEFTTKSDGYMAALTYDVLYPLLSEEDRETFGKYIDQYLVFMPKPSFGWKNNIGTGYFSAVGSIAMARMKENPEAKAILQEAIERLKTNAFPSSFEVHPDGAYPEGALYMDYAMLNFLPFVDAYERITGDKNHGLLDPEFFKNTQGFAATMIGGDGRWIPFYDSQPQDYGAVWMTFLGQRTGDPLLLWGGDYFFDRILADPSPKKRGEVTRSLIPTILYRKKGDRHPFPGLPTMSVLPSINTGSMRSDSTLQPGLMVSVRGYGENEENMRSQHKDVGSFVLFARGENFLIDPGYYQPEADAHSLPDVDGMVLTVRAPSPLQAGESGELRAMSIDPTQSYRANNRVPQQIQRTWVMDGDRAVVLVDDISGSVPVKSRFQTGFATVLEPGGQAALIKGKNSNLWMKGFGPETKLTVSGPLDFGKSWTYKQWDEEGKVSWHRVEAEYTASPENPMVWVFVPVKADGANPEVKVDRSADEISVTVNGGKAIRFVRSASGWAPADVPLQPAAELVSLKN